MKIFLAALLPLVAANSVRFPVVQDDIKFNPVNSIKSSQVSDVLSALNGYTVRPNEAWLGVKSYNPMKHPSFFLIADFGMPQDLPELTMNANLHFKLENDQSLDDEFNDFVKRSKKIWPDAPKSMMSVAAGDGDQGTLDQAKKLLQDEKFDSNNESDQAFMLEYTTFKNLIDETPQLRETQIPSIVYWVNLESLRQLAAEYGANHEKTQRAAQLFSELVGEATGKLESHKRSLFMVIQQTEKPSSRTKRAAETTGTAKEDAGLPGYDAYEYDPDWPVVFAMTTFTMLIFVLGIYATSIGLWFMDPGRDSIIYRMTSQRMKME